MPKRAKKTFLSHLLRYTSWSDFKSIVQQGSFKETQEENNGDSSRRIADIGPPSYNNASFRKAKGEGRWPTILQ